MSDKVFVIAEVGSNWRCGTRQRDLAMGKALIEGAKEAGASAVKFQVFRADTVYVQNAGAFKDHCGSDLEDIVDTFKDLEMPYELIAEFAAHARRNDIEFMATPFSIADLQAVDPHVQRHKMASYEMQHTRLWEAIIQTSKPTTFSTGGFRFDEIDRTLDWLKANGANLSAYTIMHCVASYPAENSMLGLGVIRKMIDRYAPLGLKVGYSDHSLDPVTGPAAAVALGAVSIEKHVTLNRHLPGPDHPFAIELPELARLVRACQDTFEAVREQDEKGCSEAELKLRLFAHRGLQATHALSPGDVLREGLNYAILRAGNNPKGASPLDIELFEGQTVSVEVPAGSGLLREMLASAPVPQ